MASQFIYQPHVDADGMIVTPDLPLSRLFIRAGDHAHPLAVRRLVTDQHVQVVDCVSTLQPGVLLVAASEGAILAPVAIVAPGAVAAAGVRAAASDLAAGRHGWRVKNVTDPVTVALDGAAPEPLRLAERERAPLAYGHAIVIPATRTMRAASGRHRVTIFSGDGALTHDFELALLPSG